MQNCMVLTCVGTRKMSTCGGTNDMRKRAAYWQHLSLDKGRKVKMLPVFLAIACTSTERWFLGTRSQTKMVG